jgi:hypothetical protein
MAKQATVELYMANKYIFQKMLNFIRNQVSVN